MPFLHLPLGLGFPVSLAQYSVVFGWPTESRRQELNLQPAAYKAAALPIELRRQMPCQSFSVGRTVFMKREFVYGLRLLPEIWLPVRA